MTRRLRMTVDDAMATAMQMHKQGELVEACELYNDIRRSVPDHPDALHYLGVAMHQLGDSDEGITHIRDSLELAPDNPDALNNLGNVLREVGRYDESEACYKRVLTIAPEHTDTLVNLGIVLRGLKRSEAALTKLERAIAIDPDHAWAYHNLGNVYRDLERFDDALTAYTKSKKLNPRDGESAKSIAKLLHTQGRIDDAIEVLEALLETKPDDAVAIHQLAAYSGRDIPKRAADRYIRQTFDHFAANFDESLARLKYKAPKLVAECVIEKLGDAGPKHRVLDIGCGTGLCGPLVKPVAKHLVGVDLSPNMLKRAGKRGVYDELEEAELTAYMSKQGRRFDVVICVDTFVYFGDMAQAIKAVGKVLCRDGWLFFTVEQHRPGECKDGYWLRSHGRYSHSREYIRDTLEDAGFAIDVLDDVILRLERAEPVNGTLVAAKKT